MITALFIAAGMEVSQTTATKVIVYKSSGVHGFDGRAVQSRSLSVLKCASSPGLNQAQFEPICNLCERETFAEYKNFMAGGAVMITALFIAAGMEVSQTTVTKVIVYKSCGELQ